MVESYPSELPNESAERPDKQVYWLFGYPACGKSFLGDYLSTRGLHHIDGDIGRYTDDPEIKSAF